MEVFQSIYKENNWTVPLVENMDVQWVLLFGSHDLLGNRELIQHIKSVYPNAEITGCTTSGALCDTSIYDDDLCLTAIRFKHASISVIADSLSNYQNSAELGRSLAKKIPIDRLKHVFVISDGHYVNGSDLVTGLCQELPDKVFLTGGLAGDGTRFESTHVLWNDRLEEKMVILVPIYGDDLVVARSHHSGWKPYGPDRRITKSEKNVLFEIDDKPALEMYKTYLGKHAEELPAAALRFPIGLKSPETDELIVRTILSINEDDQSMVFAGNIPSGSVCQIMHANYDNLIEASATAVEKAFEESGELKPSLAILVSCVGRRIVLGVRTDEEVDEVRTVVGDNCYITGFYSYGEISSADANEKRCGLLNQTMTVTLIEEN